MAETTLDEYDAFAQRHDFCCWVGMVAAQEPGLPGENNCPNHGDSEFAKIAAQSAETQRAYVDAESARLARIQDRAREKQLRFAELWERVFQSWGVGSECEVDWPRRDGDE